MRPCPACGGIWLGREDFENLARTHEAQDLFLGSAHGQEKTGAAVTSPLEVRYRPCPACGKFMNRTNYARISGVILDVCREDGLWFDRDELRKVVLFLEDGGLERATRREREAAPSTTPGVPLDLLGDLGGARGKTGSSSIAGLLAEVVLDAARLLAAKIH
jgi:Zn-finger nucleic acid-binding protein